MNFFDTRLSVDGLSVELPGVGSLPLHDAGGPSHRGQEVILGIRPEHFHITEEGAGTLHLRVDHVETLGADTLVHGLLGEDGVFLTVRLPDIHYFKKHTALPLLVLSEKLHLFDKESGKRIED